MLRPQGQARRRGEILTFPDTLTTQGLSLWSLNIVDGACVGELGGVLFAFLYPSLSAGAMRGVAGGGARGGRAMRARLKCALTSDTHGDTSTGYRGYLSVCHTRDTSSSPRSTYMPCCISHPTRQREPCEAHVNIISHGHRSLQPVVQRPTAVGSLRPVVQRLWETAAGRA